jgi:hypothetical protein
VKNWPLSPSAKPVGEAMISLYGRRFADGRHDFGFDAGRFNGGQQFGRNLVVLVEHRGQPVLQHAPPSVKANRLWLFRRRMPRASAGHTKFASN